MIQQIWLGDSHLRPHNGVPDAYAKVLEERKLEARFSLPEDLGWCVSGQRLTETFVSKILELIRHLAGTPTCFVLCIGTNDLRDRLNESGEKRVFRNFERILTEVRRTEGAVLLVISPIPDSLGWTDPIGEDWDKRLGQLYRAIEADADENNKNKIFYVKFRSKKLPHNNGPTRYNKAFFKDKYHLNRAGAKMLATEIFNVQTQIRKRTVRTLEDSNDA